MHFTEDMISAAAFAFEAVYGHPHGDMEKSEINRHGFNGIETNVLCREFIRLIELEQDDATGSKRCAAYFALGKKLDPALLPFLQKQLRIEVQRDMETAYQIMIALDNLNEPVFNKDRSSYSSGEDELNLPDAMDYLARLA